MEMDKKALLISKGINIHIQDDYETIEVYVDGQLFNKYSIKTQLELLSDISYNEQVHYHNNKIPLLKHFGIKIHKENLKGDFISLETMLEGASNDIINIYNENNFPDFNSFAEKVREKLIKNNTEFKKEEAIESVMNIVSKLLKEYSFSVNLEYFLEEEIVNIKALVKENSLYEDKDKIVQLIKNYNNTITDYSITDINMIGKRIVKAIDKVEKQINEIPSEKKFKKKKKKNNNNI